MFSEGSEGKQDLLKPYHKNIPSKIHQNVHFSKGLVHGFCQKNGDLLIFCFHAKGIKKKWFVKVPKEKKPS